MYQTLIRIVKRFWSDIWSVEKGHNREAEWLKDLKNDFENEEHFQENVVIREDNETM